MKVHRSKLWEVLLQRHSDLTGSRKLRAGAEPPMGSLLLTISDVIANTVSYSRGQAGRGFESRGVKFRVNLYHLSKFIKRTQTKEEYLS